MFLISNGRVESIWTPLIRVNFTNQMLAMFALQWIDKANNDRSLKWTNTEKYSLIY